MSGMQQIVSTSSRVDDSVVPLSQVPRTTPSEIEIQTCRQLCKLGRWPDWIFCCSGPRLAYVPFVLGFLMICVIAGAVEGAVLPPDVTRYESSVTEINLTG
jgi:hypothetical protein